MVQKKIVFNADDAERVFGFYREVLYWSVRKILMFMRSFEDEGKSFEYYGPDWMNIRLQGWEAGEGEFLPKN